MLGLPPPKWLRRAPLLAFVALPLLLAACGSGGEKASGTLIDAARGGTVASDDGRLTLEIPPGALTEDTEISATLVSPDEAPQALRELSEGGPAYRLEPDGLEFSEPVTVSLEVEDGLSEEGEVTAHLLFSFSEGGEPQPLTDTETVASLADGTVAVRGKLDHFSWITKTKHYLQVELEQVEPRRRAVGQEFNARVRVRNVSAEEARITMFDLAREAIVSGTLRLKGWVLGWRGPDERVAPSPIHRVPKGEGMGTGMMLLPIRFLCNEPGLGHYTVRVTANAQHPDEREPFPVRIVVEDATVECVPPEAMPQATGTPPATPPSGATGIPTPTATATATGAQPPPPAPTATRPPGIPPPPQEPPSQPTATPRVPMATSTPRPPTATRTPTAPPAPTATPKEVACIFRTNIGFDGVTIVPGQYHQGNVRVTVVNQNGAPLAEVSLTIHNVKSDQTETTANGTSDVNGSQVFGVRTTAFGLNTFTILNAEKQGCEWDIAGSDTELEWVAE